MRWVALGGWLFLGACTQLDLSPLLFRCQSDDECTDGARCDLEARVCTFARVPTDAGVEPRPPGPIRDFALGHAFGCFARDETLECWGQVYERECDQCKQYSDRPTLVPGVRAAGRIWAGGGHVCTEDEDRVRCVEVATGAPIDPGFGASPVRLAVSYRVACALERSGLVHCVSLSGDPPLLPQTMTSTLGSFTGIAMGPTHVCGLVEGRLQCAGDARYYAGLLHERDIDGVVAGQQFTCIRDNMSRVRCTGERPPELPADHIYGTLIGGEGAICGKVQRGWECAGRWLDQGAEGPVPTEVGVSGAAIFRVGGTFACALEPGVLSCFGTGESGQLGRGLTTIHAPYLPGIERVVAVEHGEYQACVLDAAGAVRCWGSDARGELGGGTDARPIAPFAVLGPARGLGLGTEATCAIDLVGDLRCLEPGGGATIEAVGPFADAAVGHQLLCTVDDLGPLRCRGTQIFGANFTEVLGVTNVEAVDSRGDGACAIHDGGRIACFGRNNAGQIVPGGPEWIDTPTEVGSFGRVVDVAVALDSACAVTDDRRAYCWGKNDLGQLGTGAADLDQHGPEPMVGPPFVDIDAGIFNFCGVTTEAEVHCWGQSFLARLGTPKLPNQATPIRVELPGPASAVSVGRESACALLVDGRLVCWGWNWAGGLTGIYPVSAEPLEVAR